MGVEFVLGAGDCSEDVPSGVQTCAKPAEGSGGLAFVVIDVELKTLPVPPGTRPGCVVKLIIDPLLPGFLLCRWRELDTPV